MAIFFTNKLMNVKHMTEAIYLAQIILVMNILQHITAI